MEYYVCVTPSGHHVYAKCTRDASARAKTLLEANVVALRRLLSSCVFCEFDDVRAKAMRTGMQLATQPPKKVDAILFVEDILFWALSAYGLTSLRITRTPKTGVSVLIRSISGAFRALSASFEKAPTDIIDHSRFESLLSAYPPSIQKTTHYGIAHVRPRLAGALSGL